MRRSILTKAPFLTFFTADVEGGGTSSETPAESATPSLAEVEQERDKWKAMSRQNEERAKANAEKAKAYDELQEQSKSELQKALEAQQAAEARAASAENAALRAKTAAKYSVPEAFLTGTTEEELEESAKALLDWRGTVEDKKPKSTPGAGAAGAQGDDIGGAQQLSREQLKGMSPAEIRKAYKEGRLNDLMGIQR